MERWLPVSGYVGRYEVSDQGRVRSLSFRGHRTEPTLMQSSANYSGYHVVTLGSNRKQFRVSRLVLTAFVGEAPEGMQACHDDGDKDNNVLSNLYWGTALENIADRARHGNHYRGENNPNAKLSDQQRTEVARRRLAGEKLKILAEEFNITTTRVSQIARASQ